MSATARQYDWIWRKAAREGKPMTYAFIRREAIEVCSPELYLRWLTATTLVDEAYMHGLDFPGFEGGNRRDNHNRQRRLVEQALVRAYLAERRAGLLPRDPGPAPGSDEALAAARAGARRAAAWRQELELWSRAAERMERERWRWRGFGAIWGAIAQLAGEDAVRA